MVDFIDKWEALEPPCDPLLTDEEIEELEDRLADIELIFGKEPKHDNG